MDPRDPNRVFVAVLGHPYGPNAERGVFRSTDGGATWKKVLYKDEQTGAVDLAFDPRDPRTVYAALWQSREAPWEKRRVLRAGQRPVQIHRRRRHLDASSPAACRRSRRAWGASASAWRPAIRTASTRWSRPIPTRRPLPLRRCRRHLAARQPRERIWGRGDDFAGVRVDPRNRDVVYVANTSTYRSTDAGETFTAIKGAPGGDDYHSIWINPDNPDIILLAADQGATLSVNYGRTWSSWYNQPTAQFYHVITDNQVPYWVYGGQQESGSVGIASRGNDGAITFREWHPVGAEE